MYDKALESAGYHDTIQYIGSAESTPTPKRRNRRRKVIWFNPPFSKNVKTNVGAKFLKLITKHFPPSNKLSKIFNRNTLKMSYSCMNNINRIIKSHNSDVMKKICQDPPPAKTCNCRVKDDCPLHGKCLVSSVIYKATVTHGNIQKQYVGLVGGSFKMRYNNHTKSFRHKRYANDTELSKYVWELKDRDTNYSIDWEVIKQSNTYRRSSGLCNLCMDEKLEILRSTNKINKRTELISTCRHGMKPPDRSKKK